MYIDFNLSEKVPNVIFWTLHLINLPCEDLRM